VTVAHLALFNRAWDDDGEPVHLPHAGQSLRHGADVDLLLALLRQLLAVPFSPMDVKQDALHRLAERRNCRWQISEHVSLVARVSHRPRMRIVFQRIKRCLGHVMFSFLQDACILHPPVRGESSRILAMYATCNPSGIDLLPMSCGQHFRLCSGFARCR